ncbi:MAG: macro domain-containing protein, partial [Blastocatellia bacterium]
MEILLRQGDITKQPDIAIVNAANTELWLGPGVAGAILDRGGEEIELEAIRQAPIALG